MDVEDLIHKLSAIKGLSDMAVKIEDQDMWMSDVKYIDVVNIRGKDCLVFYAHDKYLPPVGFRE